MTSDSEFLSKLSKNQQNSDADESDISDFNCSALVESSDDEQNPCSQNIQSTSSTSSTLPGASALSDVPTQQAINLQILSQLSFISDRLNTLERKMSKKIRIQKRKSLPLKRKPVLMLPRSHCHNTSIRPSPCQI